MRSLRLTLLLLLAPLWMSAQPGAWKQASKLYGQKRYEEALEVLNKQQKQLQGEWAYQAPLLQARCLWALGQPLPNKALEPIARICPQPPQLCAEAHYWLSFNIEPAWQLLHLEKADSLLNTAPDAPLWLRASIAYELARTRRYTGRQRSAVAPALSTVDLMQAARFSADSVDMALQLVAELYALNDVASEARSVQKTRYTRLKGAVADSVFQRSETYEQWLGQAAALELVLGDSARAFQLYTAQIQVQLGRQGAPNPTTLHSLAQMCRALRQYEAGRLYAQQAIELLKKTNNKPELAGVYGTLGNLLHLHNDHTGAETYLRYSAELWAELLPASSPQRVHATKVWAQYCYLYQPAGTALSALQLQDSLLRSAAQPLPLERAECLLLQARCYLRLKQPAVAQKIAQQALNLNRRNELTYDEVLWMRCLQEMNRALAAQQMHSQIAMNTLQASQRLKQTLLHLEPGEARLLLADYRTLLAEAIPAVQQLQDYPTLWHLMAQHRRAGNLMVLLHDSLKLHLGAPEYAVDIRSRLQEGLRQSRQLCATGSNANHLLAWQRTTVALDSLNKRMWREHPSYMQRLDMTTPPLPDSLAPGTGWLAFVMEQYDIYILATNGRKHEAWKVSALNFLAVAETFLGNLWDEAKGDPEAYARAANMLYQQLLEPACKALPDVQSWYSHSEGIVANIPLHALTTNAEGNDWQKLAYTARKYTFVQSVALRIATRHTIPALRPNWAMVTDNSADSTRYRQLFASTQMSGAIYGSFQELAAQDLQNITALSLEAKETGANARLLLNGERISPWSWLSLNQQRGLVRLGLPYTMKPGAVELTQTMVLNSTQKLLLYYPTSSQPKWTTYWSPEVYAHTGSDALRVLQATALQNKDTAHPFRWAGYQLFVP